MKRLLDDLIKNNAKLKKKEYESRVVAYIRKKYSQNDELSILRQKENKPEEFAEYNAFCEQCKAQAKLDILKE